VGRSSTFANRAPLKGAQTVANQYTSYTKPRNHTIKINEFIDNAINCDGDQCLVWQFALDHKGYARLSRLRKQYGTPLVSRAVCIEAHGPPPTPEHQAAHSIKCISRACINSKHLRWATNGENQIDSIINGTHNLQKLSQHDIIEIRTSKLTREQIEKRFEITAKQVRNIKNYQQWQWVEECDAELLFATTRPRMKDLFAP
jgi:hypothetical protein